MRKPYFSLFLLIILMFLCNFVTTCGAENYQYNKVIPDTNDLSQIQAEKKAIDYYNQHTLRGSIEGSSSFSGIETASGRYTINSNFIRFYHEMKVYYGWVISIFDQEQPAIHSLDYYIGTVIVASPSGQVLFFTDQDADENYEKLGEFLSVKGQSMYRNIKIEPLIYPSDTFGMMVYPSEYDMSKDEVDALVYDWIAQEELIPYEEVSELYWTKSLLLQYPGIVTEHIWKVFVYKEEQAVSEYQLGVYASHGTVWFASKWNPELANEFFYHTYSFLYVNNEYCDREIIDVTTLPYGDWGGWIDCIFGIDIPESDYSDVPYITNE